MSKRMLRALLTKYVPSELLQRGKRGFSAPLDRWLRGPLRDWAEGLLYRERESGTGLLNTRVVDSYWDDLVQDRAGHARIWPVLIFLAWHEHYFGLERCYSHENRVRHASRDTVSVGC